MESQDVEEYLEKLGKELTQLGFSEPIDILVVGGVYMLLFVHNRRSTEDIDICFLNGNFGLTKLPLTKSEKAFRKAINRVAKQFGIRRHWLNDDASPFVREIIEDPVLNYWRSFGPLRIYFTDHKTMLVYKLMGYSPKQEFDVSALAELLEISTYDQAQALLDSMVSPETQREYGVQETLEELFE